MISFILQKIIGTKAQRDIKKLIPIVEKVNALEEKFEKYSDQKLKLQTQEFKLRLKQGETLDDILPEAFAVVREAAKRTIKLRHFDVQIMGGIVLHQGKIAEMKTGEGKTLVATLPLYLNALLERGCHLVTVNDYLAKRDRYWMGPIYEFLGLCVGLLQHQMSHKEKKKAYSCDITYGTNYEFGFDYLRDNMVLHKDLKVQRGFYYAIVDEVDFILIDEARTPLIISGPAEETVDIYYQVDKIVNFLKRDEDFQLDEKVRSASLTEKGVMKTEKLLGIKNLYSPSNMRYVHHIVQALKAYHLFKRDVDYIVKDGEIVIVDEFTGRLMPGRRYSEGLHQALEAKEGLRIKEENQTLAVITYQNYFRMYEKLAGMTGTAETESEEFMKIYKLDVVVVPTHKLMIRVDHPDVIFKTQKEKYKAVVKQIEEFYKIGRPVLVGTTSIENSEKLSKMLRERGIPHQVLNAKHHEREAQIIARAGQKYTVTIATNMAGRGTDIMLGEGVKELGGLFVLGTERHEARRIDNQLRGRSGRQGDAGESRFYISLEDDLLRIFGSDRLKQTMERFGLKEDEKIEHPWVTKAIERAQKQVEIHHFDIRKHLLEYDDVMNKQRTIVYKERNYILESEDLLSHLEEIMKEVCENVVDMHLDKKEVLSEEKLKEILKTFINIFSFVPMIEARVVKAADVDELKRVLLQQVIAVYQMKKDAFGKELMNEFARGVMLRVLDDFWKDHLYALDQLKEAIGLRAYGQRDPLVEYKKESFGMFDVMIQRVKEEIVNYVFKLQPKLEPIRRKEPSLVSVSTAAFSKIEQTTKTQKKKIGRNDPCPCGSGKKFKFCCGK